MHSLSYYLLFSVLLLPVSAALALALCWLVRRVSRWLERRSLRGMGNRYRDESWHTLEPGARLKTRTRR